MTSTTVRPSTIARATARPTPINALNALTLAALTAAAVLAFAAAANAAADSTSAPSSSSSSSSPSPSLSSSLLWSLLRLVATPIYYAFLALLLLIGALASVAFLELGLAQPPPPELMTTITQDSPRSHIKSPLRCYSASCKGTTTGCYSPTCPFRRVAPGDGSSPSSAGAGSKIDENGLARVSQLHPGYIVSRLPTLRRKMSLQSQLLSKGIFGVDVPPSNILAVIRMKNRLPPLDVLLDKMVTRIIARFPRFRSVPVEKNGVTSWAILEPSQLSLMEHVAVIKLDNEHDISIELQSLLNKFWDLSRPLWRMYMIESPTSSVIVMDIHHSIGDGVSLVRLASELCTDLKGNPFPEWTDEKKYRFPKYTIRSYIGAIITQLSNAVWVADTPTVVKFDHIAAKYEPKRRFFTIKPFDLNAIKAIKNAHGATVNDVVLALIAGAYRRYLAVMDPKAVPDINKDQPGMLMRASSAVALPRSLTDDELHNKFIFVSSWLPTGLSGPPSRRIKAENKAMDSLKNEPLPFAQIFLQTVANKVLGYRLLSILTYQFAARHTIAVTNLRGPSEPAMICGEEIESILPVVSNTSCMWAILSYGEKLFVCCNLIPELYKDLDLLERCFKLEYDEMKKEVGL
ncbi:hypothetical protein DFJ73DRAFT_786682 [Zopfochytrium polystomum]|nr:hypothetical protein DFJ73DRAFT_786682 [Zopfochytrium polystomum]